MSLDWSHTHTHANEQGFTRSSRPETREPAGKLLGLLSGLLEDKPFLTLADQILTDTWSEVYTTLLSSLALKLSLLPWQAFSPLFSSSKALTAPLASISSSFPPWMYCRIVSYTRHSSLALHVPKMVLSAWKQTWGYPTSMRSNMTSHDAHMMLTWPHILFTWCSHDLTYCSHDAHMTSHDAHMTSHDVHMTSHIVHMMLTWPHIVHMMLTWPHMTSHVLHILTWSLTLGSPDSLWELTWSHMTITCSQSYNVQHGAVLSLGYVVGSCLSQHEPQEDGDNTMDTRSGEKDDLVKRALQRLSKLLVGKWEAIS